MNKDWKIIMNLIRGVFVIALVVVFFNAVRIVSINNLNAADLILFKKSTLGGSGSLLFLLMIFLLYRMYKYLALHISNKEFAGIANSVDTRRCI
jgi:hypothetical protein